MATEADQVMVETSTRNNAEPLFFTEKKTNFITDSSSNSGNFSSGQISFDLSTFSSQNWQSLSEATIEFPVKITAELSVAAGATATDSSTKLLTAISKNGYHQWINSAQLIINGQTIQSQQPYENVAASYRILSKWSNDTLTKWGDACGFALDDCTADSEVATAYNVGIGLNNVPFATLAPTNAKKGIDTVNFQSVLFNKGVSARSQFINTNADNSNSFSTILGNAAYKNSGKSNVSVKASAGNIVGTTYVQNIMATVRVKDLFDIDEFPLVKNIRGFIYLTFNSFKTTLTSGGSSANNLGTITYQPMTGLTCPYNIILDSTVGLNLGYSSATPQPSIVITGTINGASDYPSTNLTAGNSAPLLSNARLLLPFYEATPQTDSALTKSNHVFKTYEKIVNPFTLSTAESKNITITVGVTNPTKLVLLPMWQNLGDVAAVTGLTNPEQSPWDCTPATSGIFAKLDNIQIYVSNKGLFQYPVQYDYEYWIQEGIQNGAYSGKVDEISSGLLSKQVWEQNHRFYAFDLSRRLPSDNGMSRSVQISCTNPSNTYGMKVIAILFYEKQYAINTSSCQIISAGDNLMIAN